MTKVKIKSDGTGIGTKVYVDDKDISDTVTEVRWSIRPVGFAEVTLKLTDVTLDVDGQMAMKFEGPPRTLPLTTDARARCGNCGEYGCDGCVPGDMKR